MIDYSTMEETRTTVELSELYGVSTDKINEYLSSAWLKAKLAIGSTTDWKSYCLAEYRSTCGVAGVWDTFFHLRMHPPRLQPLCSNEAIVYFSVDEVLFYEDADFTKRVLLRLTVGCSISHVFAGNHDENSTAGISLLWRTLFIMKSSMGVSLDACWTCSVSLAHSYKQKP